MKHLLNGNGESLQSTETGETDIVSPLNPIYHRGGGIYLPSLEDFAFLIGKRYQRRVNYDP